MSFADGLWNDNTFPVRKDLPRDLPPAGCNLSNLESGQMTQGFL
jgi:hypothetical protein